VNSEQIFETWAPAGALWSPWVKPVLFAHLSQLPPAPSEPQPAAGRSPTDPAWAPPADDPAVLVLDLPGELGVRLGLQLAQAGYRPIPLYNAAPGPHGVPLDRRVSRVDVLPIMTAIRQAGGFLGSLKLPAGAPPAFLLDAGRSAGPALLLPACDFDNRSVSLFTDFPSANFLLAHGYRRAILVQAGGRQPQPDLAHTLRRWQEAGIAIAAKPLDDAGPAEPITVARPSWFGWVWYRMLATVGLRRSVHGGFGGFVHAAAG
jgi:hypothetical protein